ncbi:hypothetical protein [Persicitalea sp.]|uniref:hypothetical protein n=1 Tax=Persicitalea sp. TaxID=3100273 RepID=UPI00359328EB
MKRYCLALDLKDDPVLIEKYKWHHAPENQWPEINQSRIPIPVIEFCGIRGQLCHCQTVF